jgi:Tol biopolymer transport system component
MNPDGTDQRPLPTPAAGMAPSWSPDGAQIVFASERSGNADIYVMDANGGNQRPLVTGEAWDYLPFWSPGGDHIAFTTTRDGGAAVYVVSPEGSEPTRVSGRGLVADVASWSPDGTRLVFHGRETPRDEGILGWFEQ